MNVTTAHAPAAPLTGREEWRRGWRLVAAGAAGLAASGTIPGAIGVVMVPLQNEFGWSRAQISASLFASCIAVLVFSPLFGLVIDRIGARRVAVSGITLYLLTVFLVGLSGPGINSWLACWALVGVCGSMAGPVVYSTAVSRAFDKERGLALALTASGLGVGALISPLLATVLLQNFGWRGVYFGISLVGAAYAVPAIWVWYRPELYNSPRPVEADSAAQGPGYTIARILRSGRFWVVVVCMLLVSISVGSITVHFQPLLLDAGLTPLAAAGAASLSGPASIVGHYFVGRLLDRFPIQVMTVAIFAVPGVLCLSLLAYDQSTLLTIIAAVLLGLSMGIETDVMSYLATRYFGLRNFPFAFGLLVGVFSVGFGFGPVLAGVAFDALGNYTALICLLLGGIVISVLLALTLGRPPTAAEFDAAA